MQNKEARKAKTFPGREAKTFPERETKTFPAKEAKTYSTRESKASPKEAQSTSKDAISIVELVQLRGEESFKSLNVNGNLSQLNLKLHPAGRDGNCLYRSFSQNLYGTESMHERCRAQIAAFVADEANKNLFDIYTLAHGASIN